MNPSKSAAAVQVGWALAIFLVIVGTTVHATAGKDLARQTSHRLATPGNLPELLAIAAPARIARQRARFLARDGNTKAALTMAEGAAHGFWVAARRMRPVDVAHPIHDALHRQAETTTLNAAVWAIRGGKGNVYEARNILRRIRGFFSGAIALMEDHDPSSAHYYRLNNADGHRNAIVDRFTNVLEAYHQAPSMRSGPVEPAMADSWYRAMNHRLEEAEGQIDFASNGRLDERTGKRSFDKEIGLPQLPFREYREVLASLREIVQARAKELGVKVDSDAPSHRDSRRAAAPAH